MCVSVLIVIDLSGAVAVGVLRLEWIERNTRSLPFCTAQLKC